MFEFIADKIGFPEDQVRLILLIVAAYPLAIVNFYLKNPTIRLWYGLLTGLILQYLMYDLELLHLVAATLITYLFITFFGRKLSSFWIVGITVAHLSFLHIRRMIQDFGGWKMDVTTIYMMSICKFSGIAFSYEDGGVPNDQIRNSYHRSKRIKEKPTLLETFSYMFYFSTAIVGPSFEFSDFRQFINLEGPYEHLPSNLAVKYGLIEFFISVSNIGAFAFFANTFDYNYCITEEYGNKTFLYRFMYYNIAMLIQRVKYYGGWKMAQSSLVFCGLTYNPVSKNSTPGEDEKNKDTEHLFDKVESCGIREVEFNVNPKVKIQYWNRTVHLWLKYNVFLRLLNVNHKLFKNNKGMASLITFMVSAFWHGFYPVYYIFFFLFYILEQNCTFLEEEYNLFLKLESKDIFTQQIFGFLANTFCNYLGIIFSLLTIGNAYQFSKNIHFLPPLLLIVIFLYLRNKSITRKRAERKAKERDNANKDQNTPNPDAVPEPKKAN